jgi:hypothetical protein
VVGIREQVGVASAPIAQARQDRRVAASAQAVLLASTHSNGHLQAAQRGPGVVVPDQLQVVESGAADPAQVGVTHAQHVAAALPMFFAHGAAPICVRTFASASNPSLKCVRINCAVAS